jgi:cell fate regulator YaaT (PSP1 superfamily)
MLFTAYRATVCLLFIAARKQVNQQAENNNQEAAVERPPKDRSFGHFKVQFRPEEQVFSAITRLQGLQKNEVVMVQTDHGLEPARVLSGIPEWPAEEPAGQTGQQMTIARRGTRDEVAKFEKLGEMEHNAFRLCTELIEQMNLPMSLVKVERFFNGGKIIFYFTAENRVDFRELVKNLVQEFRTRVEMRQIGVRHETKMLGGLGCCGRELCCSSFIQNFESVSIKMAKEQNLPLNPAKISGACNRLLCCLNYEYKTYKSIRRGMPKIGRKITYNDRVYKVLQHNVLREEITVAGDDSEELTLSKDEWLAAAAHPASKDK